MQFLTSAVTLPSKEKMRESMNDDIYQRQIRGLKKRKMHVLGTNFMRPYLSDLASIANIDPIKPVIVDIYDRARYMMQNHTRDYRKYNYRIIDDYNFVNYL